MVGSMVGRMVAKMAVRMAVKRVETKDAVSAETSDRGTAGWLAYPTVVQKAVD